MTTPELTKWLRENSSGVYRPAGDAADLIDDLVKKFTKLDKPKCSGDPMLDSVLGTPNADFREWVRSLPPTYWARYDLSAARIGWEAACKFIQANVKEHATLSAGASVDHGVEVETTLEHENRAADRGCCVSPCSLSSIPVLRVVPTGNYYECPKCGAAMFRTELTKKISSVTCQTPDCGNRDQHFNVENPSPPRSEPERTVEGSTCSNQV